MFKTSILKPYFSVIFVFILTLSSAQKKIKIPLKKFKISVLSDTLKETSGLSFFNHQLYTLNDGGNSSEIYQINPLNGKIVNRIAIPVQNKDWEALGFSDTDLYIGDFGNNAGNRTDLKVYKISFHNQPIQSVQAIPYFYPQQKDFSSKNIKNNFDAEALIYLHGKIHIFSKEWVSKSTTHYELNPNSTLLQPAVEVEKYPTGFVVTDAAYYQSKLYLLGYTKKTKAYLMVFNETEPGVFFSQEPQKYSLGTTLKVSQLEGIAVDENGIFISGEAFHSPLGIQKQSFFKIPHAQLNP